MRFWDTSAILPLFLEEPQSETMRSFLKEDDEIVAWWGASVECLSSFARLRRESVINTRDEDHLRAMLAKLSANWTEIQPANDLRLTAGQLLLRHPLRAADSLQLAAALLWCDSAPQDHIFVCLDSRLHAAGRVEGFTMLPSFLS